MSPDLGWLLRELCFLVSVGPGLGQERFYVREGKLAWKFTSRNACHQLLPMHVVQKCVAELHTRSTEPKTCQTALKGDLKSFAEAQAKLDSL